MILLDRSYLFRDAADRHDIPLPLLLAVVRTESAFETDAVRYEKGYRWTMPFGDAGGTDATELVTQQMSWGLMQIMGATARAVGFEDPWMTRLLDPRVNLEYGCRYLAQLVERWHGNLRNAVAAYNAGTVRWEQANSSIYVNQAYVDKVFTAAEEYGLWNPS